MERSWIPVAADSHFPIQNLPFGVFSSLKSEMGAHPRPGVAIGAHVLDLSVLQREGLLSELPFDTYSTLGRGSGGKLNNFMGLDRSCWRATRNLVKNLLLDDATKGDPRLRNNAALQKEALLPLDEIKMHLPAEVGDYTDFYSSREHATNVGIMFRGKDNALQPNWLHLPVGYHGRASSVVISGTDVVRPSGQLQIDRDDPSKGSSYGPCRLLDFELEMAFFLGGPANALGRPLTIAEAEDRIFGVVVMNDWSARDIQAWEYVPLGPFTAKNFATSISPWIVSLDALAPFRCSSSAGPEQSEPVPLPYLRDPEYATGSFNVNLEVALQPETDAQPSVISRSNLKYMYWNMKQQLVHHSVTGCTMRPGDLLGTGTISGPVETSLGSMLEMSWRGAKDIKLENSATGDIRKFLKDGDTVIMSGYAEGDGYRIGFGSCSGKVLPVGSVAPNSIVSPTPSLTTAQEEYKNFKLYSYWRSSSSYRVRIAMNLKGISYEYAAINLKPLVGNTDKTLPADFISVNPMQQVPVLQFSSHQGDHQLSQSLPIIEFLDESYPHVSPLLPSSPLLKAKVREIAEIVNSGIQPIQNIRMLRQIQSATLIGSQEKTDGAGISKDAQLRGLESLERIVSALAPPSSSIFAAGTSYPTLADICIVPQLYSAARVGIDVSSTGPFPALAAVGAKCATLEAFQKAAPEVQPDADP